jgi:hypothetical protein
MKAKRAGGTALVVEHLPSKSKALTSNTNTDNKKKERKPETGPFQQRGHH